MKTHVWIIRDDGDIYVAVANGGSIETARIYVKDYLDRTSRSMSERKAIMLFVNANSPDFVVDSYDARTAWIADCY